MSENRYFAKDSPDASEQQRLAFLTQFADPTSIRRLTDLGVRPGWRCLEVGAGNGSVARWLAGRVGSEGHIVATDFNPRFLGESAQPNLEVRRHNILEDELEAGHYDLVHCRAVLMHLPEPLQALRRMLDAVRPGGWLLVEEADVCFCQAADPQDSRAAEFDRQMRLMRSTLKAAGHMDGFLARRLPALIEGLGVRELGYDGVTLLGRGGSPIARFVQMTNELLRDRFVAAGVLTEAEFDAMHRAYDDPTFWFMAFTIFGIWGRCGRASRSQGIRIRCLES